MRSHCGAGARPRRIARRCRHDDHASAAVNLHEYQARELLRRHGIPVPADAVADTPDQVRAVAQRLGGKVVVKAQVHAGGRGKAGGVKLANTPDEAAAHASRILGMQIKGLTVHKVLVAPAVEIADTGLDRRPEIAALRDATAEAPSEVQAREAGLTFVKLDGTVGCCVNGAGLAMATMDLVKYYGGAPANFLDIGGSSNPQKVVSALRIITADPSVKAILFNIFGGITRGDDVANGIVQATQQFPIKVPLVIRLTGTNEAEAIAILTKAGFSALTDMDEAVKRAVAQANA